MRNMVFVSHASPEDDEFTLWLALQLANSGYPVWCDLTKFLGGEDFWKDIELAIRERTVKFLYVLSKTSNNRDGPRKELQVAVNVARDNDFQEFVVPLLIDDLPLRDTNIQIANINAIPFNKGWSHALQDLLKKLEQDQVPTNPNFTPSAVTKWWRDQFSSEKGLSTDGEEYLSNWFPIQLSPNNLYFHSLGRSGIGKLEIQQDLPYPGFQHTQFLVTFAPAEDFKGKLMGGITIAESKSFPIHDLIQGNIETNLCTQKEARGFISQLLRMSWDKFTKDRGLSTYMLANEQMCVYPTYAQLKDDWVSFRGVSDKPSRRQLIGYKSISISDAEEDFKRFWHFALAANPFVYPTMAYTMKSHVVFTLDGTTVLPNKKQLHRARRTQCKDWWNDDWRDRTLAMMTWLAGQGDEIRIAVGTAVTLSVAKYPLIFQCPVSYKDPDKEPSETMLLESDIEDDEDDDSDVIDGESKAS